MVAPSPRRPAPTAAPRRYAESGCVAKMLIERRALPKRAPFHSIRRRRLRARGGGWRPRRAIDVAGVLTIPALRLDLSLSSPSSSSLMVERVRRRLCRTCCGAAGATRRGSAGRRASGPTGPSTSRRAGGTTSRTPSRPPSPSSRAGCAATASSPSSRTTRSSGSSAPPTPAEPPPAPRESKSCR